MFLILKRKISRKIFLFLNYFYEILKFINIYLYYNNKKFYTNLFRYKDLKKLLIKDDQFYEELKVICNFFNLRDIKILLDIGANFGAWSVSANKIFKDSKIYSFEPLNYNFKLLKKNLIEYKNIQLFNFALGNENLEKYISFPEWETNYKRIGNTGLFSLLGGTNISKEKVILKKFDDLELGFNKDLNNKTLVKIDVEGYEFEVLKGMSNFLKNKNLIIKLELNNKSWKNARININEFLEYIEKYHFNIFYYEKKSIYPLNNKQIKEIYTKEIDLELVLSN